MVLFKLNPHIITFFFFIALLLLKQSISEHNNVPSRLLKDSKLFVPNTGVVQEEEQNEIGSSNSPFDTKKKENVEDEEMEKEGKDEINKETKDEEDEIGKSKKKNKDDKDEEKTVYEEFDENEKKKEKEDDIEKGEKGMKEKKKKVKKEDENEANEKFDENGIKKKKGEKDDEKEAYEEFDENGRKQKKDGEQTGYEEFDENGKKKKKKKNEEFHDIGMQKETKDEEKAKDKKYSSSSDSFNSIESLLSLTDSLKKNPAIPPSIVLGCKKADFPPECEATLLSSEKDAKKFDASSIFEISVKALSKALNISKTLAQNPNMGINPKDASDCEKMYKDSISALKGAMKAFKEKDKYMTSLKLSTVVTNMDTCENGIGQDSTSDLGRANKVLSKLAANAICLGDAVMHFNTDQ